MVEYVVTTRNAKGLREERAYTAESRSDLFKKLAADGVHAISVREGTLGKKPRKAVGGGVSPKGRVFIAAAVAVFIVGVAAWLMWPEAEKPVEVKKEVKKQRVVEKKQVSREVAKPEPEEEDLGWVTNRLGEVVKRKRPETYRDKRGVLRYKAGGARAPEKDEFKNPISVRAASNHPEFKYSCENAIATLLTIEPGDTLAGEPDFGERFKMDFVKSLMEPIKINKEDSEYDKEIKRLVEEQKRDLAKRIKEGEDLETIFTEARSEARRLAAVKKEILAMAHEMTLDENMSEEDAADCYKAANRLLEDKGLAPVKYDGFMRRRLMMSQRVRKQQENQR